MSDLSVYRVEYQVFDFWWTHGTYGTMPEAQKELKRCRKLHDKVRILSVRLAA